MGQNAADIDLRHSVLPYSEQYSGGNKRPNWPIVAVFDFVCQFSPFN